MVCLLLTQPHIDKFCFLEIEKPYPLALIKMPGVNEGTPSGEMNQPEYPPWLDDLILATFFKKCSQHESSPKSEKNFFCIDCCGESLCSYCVSNHHSGQNHRIFQIRRSSYKEAVRLSDVSKLVDLTDIQIYVINSAKIVFINSRPQDKPSKGAAFSCKTCHRTLIDSNKYCSLQCKLEALADDKTVNLLPKTVVSPSALLSISPPESNLNFHSDFLKSSPKSPKSQKRSRSPNAPESPKTPKTPKVFKTPKIPKTPNASKGKRKASVFLKDEREVFSKEYDFKLIEEYPSSVSPPPLKRRRTPKVFLDVVNYDPHPMLAELPEEDIFVPLSILQPVSPISPRKRSRKGCPQRASSK